MNDPIMDYLKGSTPNKKRGKRPALKEFDVLLRSSKLPTTPGFSWKFGIEDVHKPQQNTFGRIMRMKMGSRYKDSDFDGVPDYRDCQPRNPFMQDWPESKDPSTGKAPRHQESQLARSIAKKEKVKMTKEYSPPGTKGGTDYDITDWHYYLKNPKKLNVTVWVTKRHEINTSPPNDTWKIMVVEQNKKGSPNYHFTGKTSNAKNAKDAFRKAHTRIISNKLLGID